MRNWINHGYINGLWNAILIVLISQMKILLKLLVPVGFLGEIHIMPTCDVVKHCDMNSTLVPM